MQIYMEEKKQTKKTRQWGKENTNTKDNKHTHTHTQKHTPPQEHTQTSVLFYSARLKAYLI